MVLVVIKCQFFFPHIPRPIYMEILLPPLLHKCQMMVESPKAVSFQRRRVVFHHFVPHRCHRVSGWSVPHPYSYHQKTWDCRRGCIFYLRLSHGRKQWRQPSVRFPCSACKDRQTKVGSRDFRYCSSLLQGKSERCFPFPKSFSFLQRTLCGLLDQDGLHRSCH